MKQSFRVVCFVTMFGLLQLTALAQGPVAHWPLKTDARDVAKFGLHGTTSGGIRFETPDDGQQAARFDGRDGSVEVATHDELQVGTSDFALATTIKLAGATDFFNGSMRDVKIYRRARMPNCRQVNSRKQFC